MKKIYLKPELEKVVVTPLFSIQAASPSPSSPFPDTLNGGDLNGTSEEMNPDEEALSKTGKGMGLWD